MNMSPQQIFGNFGTMQPYRSQQSTFTSEGFVSLGGEHAWANRMGREMVLCLHNQLRWANLNLDIDLNTLLKSISYRSIDGRDVSLEPLPYHPKHDQSLVMKYLSYYSHLRSECTAMSNGMNSNNGKFKIESKLIRLPCSKLSSQPNDVVSSLRLQTRVCTMIIQSHPISKAFWEER